MFLANSLDTVDAGLPITAPICRNDFPCAQHRDLFTVRERQTAAFEVPAPAWSDAAGSDQDPRAGPPVDAEREHRVGEEVTRLHPCPEDLEQVRSNTK